VRKLQDSGVFCHFYPAGCTDLLQLVDAGIGSATTTYMKEFLDIWLEEATDGLSNNDRLTRKRAEGNHVSARERRVLYTHLLAKAWTKLCDKVDFYEMANKVGNNLAADGSRDNLARKCERASENIPRDMRVGNGVVLARELACFAGIFMLGSTCSPGSQQNGGMEELNRADIAGFPLELPSSVQARPPAPSPADFFRTSIRDGQDGRF